MANPFDQFASDFNAALPPAPAMTQQPPLPPAPMGGMPGSFQQQYQHQSSMYSGFQNGMPSQTTPLDTFDAPSPDRSGFTQSNPYEQQPIPGVMPPYSMDQQPAYMASPPTPQQGPPIFPGSYGEVDAGNPFASPPVDSPFGMPVSDGGTGFDSSQSFNIGPPPPMPPTQQLPFEGSTSLGMMPPAPVADPVSFSDPWGAPPAASQQPTPPAYGSFVTPQSSVGAPPQQQPDPSASFVGAYPASNAYGQTTHQQQPDPNFGALVPSQQQSNPYASFAQPTNPYTSDPYGQQHPQPDPYGQQSYGVPPVQDPYQQQHAYGQPYGYPPVQQQYQPPPPTQQHYQPPPPAPVDPFSVFESQARAPEPAPPSNALVAYTAPNPVENDDDFWSSFGPNKPEPPAPSNTSPPTAKPAEVAEPKPKAEEEKKGDEGLPPGGEFYDARIFTPTLGVMFFKPQELTDSLFLNTDRDIVDSLAERPVVAFIVEGSSARAAGVELGHVLLKVNGVDVKSPKEASRLIKEGPRPLPLLFYVPNTDVVTAEGEHMVKYDTRETTAPNSAKDWKPKYVVIGGIIAQPWMMNMYRSKSEYDIAVIETQARRPVSVKVKQFSLQGARIQNDWQGPQMVKYKNKLHPWKYVVVLPVARNPIKISSPNLSQLKPVHEGIRRVLLAQQRDRVGGGHQRSASARSGDGENYGRAYNGYAEEQQGGYNQQHHNGYAQQAEATRY